MIIPSISIVANIRKLFEITKEKIKKFIMIVINSLNGGRIYRGSSAEIQALVFPGNFTYEEYSSTTVYFYTTDKAMAIEKPVSEQTVIDSFVLFHFTKSELDVLEDGVLYYTCDYGTVQREFNTQWYLTSPLGYVTSEYATEEWVESAITEAISEIPPTDLSAYYTSAQTDSAIANATSGLSGTYVDLTSNQTINGTKTFERTVLAPSFGEIVNNNNWAVGYVQQMGLMLMASGSGYYGDIYLFPSNNMSVAILDSGGNPHIVAVKDDLDEKVNKTTFNGHTADTMVHKTESEVVSIIQNYLNQNNYMTFSQVNELVDANNEDIYTAMGNFVASPNIRTMKKVTQAEYDALGSGRSDTTVYVIDE